MRRVRRREFRFIKISHELPIWVHYNYISQGSNRLTNLKDLKVKQKETTNAISQNEIKTSVVSTELG